MGNKLPHKRVIKAIQKLKVLEGEALLIKVDSQMDGDSAMKLLVDLRQRGVIPPHGFAAVIPANLGIMQVNALVAMKAMEKMKERSEPQGPKLIVPD